MIRAFIPNYDAEAARLSAFAPSGWVLAFNLTPFGPKLMDNTFPKKWQEIYGQGPTFQHDPVWKWIAQTSDSMIRWSEITIPDELNILAAARSHGLVYGAAFQSKIGGKQSFLSVSRKDREFLDAEMSEMSAKFTLWSNLLDNDAGLTPNERAVLFLLRDGLSQTEVAAKLNVSLPTIKARLKQIHAKLGATNTTQAVAMATVMDQLKHLS
ncbi:helix-turn-helix transcriptional regulator [Paracoccus laeviglucosivorans]|uniref:Autoinducer binding domain-containing protein n=1 Tax=Paracoccus laeviglucosivorans TaxID=1197861 RepID=A0A521FC82_9RHOB|nr:autoinducer binding domain-containing protein [Paracoccus laeviglucosivorans]SMO93769.1 Autoinducer binding domain-containing protein [Paracoccus laeviglucosivorans]